VTTMDDLRRIIEGLIDCGAVLFDVEPNHSHTRNFLRVWSTRELLTDDIRDALILRWRDSLGILRELLGDRIDFSVIDGLCVKQSDRGFDAHDLSWSEKHGHVHGNYRWS
jgi:hypothetical protein